MGTCDARRVWPADAMQADPARRADCRQSAMTDTVLWTAFYVLIALVVVAVLARFIAGAGRADGGRRGGR